MSRKAVGKALRKTAWALLKISAVLYAQADTIDNRQNLQPGDSLQYTSAATVTFEPRKPLNRRWW